LSDKGYDPNKVSDDIKIQEWFKKLANQRLISINSPLSTQLFRERFERFRKFTCIQKEKGKPPVKMERDISRINEIYDRFEMSPSFIEMIENKCKELDALLYVCQPLSSGNLENIRRTLTLFDELPVTIIKKRLDKALGDLKASLGRQQSIEDYLRKIEYSTVSPGKLYRSELIEDKRLRENFLPAVNSYLDKVEKSFLKD
jgi:hypothetical protein